MTRTCLLYYRPFGLDHDNIFAIFSSVLSRSREHTRYIVVPIAWYRKRLYRLAYRIPIQHHYHTPPLMSTITATPNFSLLVFQSHSSHHTIEHYHFYVHWKIIAADWNKIRRLAQSIASTVEEVKTYQKRFSARDRVSLLVQAQVRWLKNIDINIHQSLLPNQNMIIFALTHFLTPIFGRLAMGKMWINLQNMRCKHRKIFQM